MIFKKKKWIKVIEYMKGDCLYIKTMHIDNQGKIIELDNKLIDSNIKIVLK